jgi:type IV pilus assembly protein PilW
MYYRLPNQLFTAGVTLIEMMISLTIGLVIIAAVGYIYLASNANFKGQDALSRMQESARSAFEILGRDVRMAGLTGCPTNTADDVNVLVDTEVKWYKNLLKVPLMGYEKPAGTAWGSFPVGLTGVVGNVRSGDVLTVLHADITKEFIVKTHTPASNPPQFTLTANHEIKQGETLVVAKDSCSNVAVFQNTKACTINPVTNTCDHAIIEHNATGCTSGNFRKGLGSKATALGTCPDGTEDTFGINSRIYRLSAASYYIRTNPGGEPSLYKQVMIWDNGATNPTTAQELVEGVEDMQIQYGVDAANDGAIDSYVNADAVANWSKVYGIRISLLMVSTDRDGEKNITSAKQTYRYNGNAIEATDNKLRKVFTTTIALKNRL